MIFFENFQQTISIVTYNIKIFQKIFKLILNVLFQLINVNNVKKFKKFVVVYFNFVERENELTTFDIININFRIVR